MKIAVQRIKGSDTKVILHSDQGSQYSAYEYQIFAKKQQYSPKYE